MPAPPVTKLPTPLTAMHQQTKMVRKPQNEVGDDDAESVKMSGFSSERERSAKSFPNPFMGSANTKRRAGRRFSFRAIVTMFLIFALSAGSGLSLLVVHLSLEELQVSAQTSTRETIETVNATMIDIAETVSSDLERLYDTQISMFMVTSLRSYFRDFMDIGHTISNEYVYNEFLVHDLASCHELATWFLSSLTVKQDRSYELPVFAVSALGNQAVLLKEGQAVAPGIVYVTDCEGWRPAHIECKEDIFAYTMQNTVFSDPIMGLSGYNQSVPVTPDMDGPYRVVNWFINHTSFELIPHSNCYDERYCFLNMETYPLTLLDFLKLDNRLLLVDTLLTEARFTSSAGITVMFSPLKRPGNLTADGLIAQALPLAKIQEFIDDALGDLSGAVEGMILDSYGRIYASSVEPVVRQGILEITLASLYSAVDHPSYIISSTAIALGLTNNTDQVQPLCKFNGSIPFQVGIDSSIDAYYEEMDKVGASAVCSKMSHVVPDASGDMVNFTIGVHFLGTLMGLPYYLVLMPVGVSSDSIKKRLNVAESGANFERYFDSLVKLQESQASETRLVVVYVAVVLSLFALVMTLIAALTASSELTYLSAQLEYAAELRLERVGDVARTSYIREIYVLRQAFRICLRMLREFRKFVPQHLLTFRSYTADEFSVIDDGSTYSSLPMSVEHVPMDCGLFRGRTIVAVIQLCLVVPTRDEIADAILYIVNIVELCAKRGNFIWSLLPCSSQLAPQVSDGGIPVNITFCVSSPCKADNMRQNAHFTAQFALYLSKAMLVRTRLTSVSTAELPQKGTPHEITAHIGISVSETVQGNCGSMHQRWHVELGPATAHAFGLANYASEIGLDILVSEQFAALCQDEFLLRKVRVLQDLVTLHFGQGPLSGLRLSQPFKGGYQSSMNETTLSLVAIEPEFAVGGRMHERRVVYHLLSRDIAPSLVPIDPSVPDPQNITVGQLVELHRLFSGTVDLMMANSSSTNHVSMLQLYCRVFPLDFAARRLLEFSLIPLSQRADISEEFRAFCLDHPQASRGFERLGSMHPQASRGFERMGSMQLSSTGHQGSSFVIADTLSDVESIDDVVND